MTNQEVAPKTGFGHEPLNRPMTPFKLTTLFAMVDRHPNALGYELRHASLNTLEALVYQEHAEPAFLADVPDALASAAYDEIERRVNALARLRRDCPGLRLPS